MRYRALISASTLATMLVFWTAVPVPVNGQSAAPGRNTAKADTLRTSWGKPDLQGVWDFRTVTPLERPLNWPTRPR